MLKTYTCSGCGKNVASMSVKAHIKNCGKYDSFYLRKMKSLNSSDNINEIKVLILLIKFLSE